jgi:hypothetical protein
MTCIDPNESIDTYVTNIRLISCYRIADVAVLFDLLATRTGIKFITNFDGLKYPFLSSSITCRAPRLTRSSNVSPISCSGLTACFCLSFFMMVDGSFGSFPTLTIFVSDFDNQILYRKLHHLNSSC